jgi:hypothetical protein
MNFTAWIVNGIKLALVLVSPTSMSLAMGWVPYGSTYEPLSIKSGLNLCWKDHTICKDFSFMISMGTFFYYVTFKGEGVWNSWQNLTSQNAFVGFWVTKGEGGSKNPNFVLRNKRTFPWQSSGLCL